VTDFLPRPVVGPPPTWHFPRPRRTRLSNDIELAVYTLPGQHVVSAHLILDVGLEAEPRTYEGVAALTARSLDEGTRRHPGEEFAEVLETEGAGFGIDVSLDGLQAVLDVPASRLEAALPLFAEAVTEPALATEDIERHVQLRLAEIEQAHANPAQLASIAFRAAVFDEASRASRMSGGEAKTVQAVEPEQVRTFHRDWFGPRGAVLVLAGEFRSDPTVTAEQVFGGWRPSGQRAMVRNKPAAAPPRSILVDRPGSVQADVRLGGFGVDRRHPGWADLTVAGYAMGGAFLSRLNAVLREDKGYTYGVRFAATPLRRAGWYALQGSFRTEVVPEALATARELLSVSGRPFTAEEVADAVAYFVGVSPLRYATADGVADQAAVHVLAELGDDYVDRSLADISAVTPESATAAYRELVELEPMSLVVVGDAERLEAPLRAQGLNLQVVPRTDSAPDRLSP